LAGPPIKPALIAIPSSINTDVPTQILKASKLQFRQVRNMRGLFLDRHIGRCCWGALCVLALLMLDLGSGRSQTPAWPTRTVTVVVGFDAGGVTDVLARLMSQNLSEQLGQSFIVENKTGAGGILAANYVAHAAPDGYTLLFAAAPQMLATPKIQTAKFDPIDDFSTVSSVGANSFVLVIKPSIPAKTIPEFVAYAKTHQITYGSPGAGSITHLLSALFVSRAEIQATHIPFRGGGQALTALLAGQIDMYFSPIGNVLPYANTPQVTLLGVATQQRLAQLPNVPTIGEFYPNTILPSWNGVMAPAKTPKDVVDKLARLLVAMVKNPEMVAAMDRLGVEPQGQSPEEFAAHLKSDGLQFDDAIKAAGLK
jgi:tripartite-type tricarboxylate transporter receptor subunit TctC